MTVFPGGLDQCGLVRAVLAAVGRESVVVGATPRMDDKERVGNFYRRWLGDIVPAEPDCTATEALERSAQLGCHLLTGAPLTNVSRWYDASHETFQSWTCQGGFAGDSVVPERFQLDKFRGMETCPTFNLNGDPKGALKLLASARMGRISMVSKNVCHGFWFGRQRTDALPRDRHAGLSLMLRGMDTYLAKYPDGKALHDILAALMAIAPDLGVWVHGAPYREKGQWGFSADPTSETRILIAVDEEAALRRLIN